MVELSERDDESRIWTEWRLDVDRSNMQSGCISAKWIGTNREGVSGPAEAMTFSVTV